MGIGVRKELKHMLFSRSAVSNSLPPHGLQHTRPPCPSPSPEACSNSHPLSRWCHPTSLSSVIPFSSFLQSFPASGPFLMSRLFPRWPKYWSLSFRISPSNEYSGLSRVFSNTTVQKHQFFGAQPTFVPTLTSVPDYQLGTVLCLCMGGRCDAHVFCLVPGCDAQRAVSVQKTRAFLCLVNHGICSTKQVSG